MSEHKTVTVNAYLPKEYIDWVKFNFGPSPSGLFSMMLKKAIDELKATAV